MERKSNSRPVGVAGWGLLPRRRLTKGLHANEANPAQRHSCLFFSLMNPLSSSPPKLTLSMASSGTPRQTAQPELPTLGPRHPARSSSNSHQPPPSSILQLEDQRGYHFKQGHPRKRKPHAHPLSKALREKHEGLAFENTQVLSGQSSCQGPAGPGTAPHAAGRQAGRKRGAGGPCGPQGPGQSRGDAGRSARRGANPDRCSGSGPRGHAPSWAWTREWEGGPGGAPADRQSAEGRRVSGGAGRSSAGPGGCLPYLPPAGPPPRPPPAQPQLLAPLVAGPSRRQSCERAPRDFLRARLSSAWPRPAHTRAYHAHSQLIPAHPGLPRPRPTSPRLLPSSPRPAPSRPGHAAPGRAGGAVRARAQPSRVRRSSPPVRCRHPRPLVQPPPALTQAPTQSFIHLFTRSPSRPPSRSPAHSFTH